MSQKTTAGLWCKLESLYIMKSLSNKLFLKKHLYSFQMKSQSNVDRPVGTVVKTKRERQNSSVAIFSSSELWSPGDHHHIWKRKLRVGKKSGKCTKLTSWWRKQIP